MNAKERVLAAIAGKPVDYVPSGFWLHFPQDQHHGDAAVQAHLDFCRETGTDILKVMTENLVPTEHGIQRGADWKRVKAYNRNSPFVRDQVEIMKRVLDAVQGEPMVLATIHGIVASAWHAYIGPERYETDRHRLGDFLREDTQAMDSALDALAESVCVMVEELLAAGADGIYYAALGGEKNLFTAEEFERHIKPRDLQILNAAGDSVRILHMCKDGLDLERYREYPCQVANWGVFENNPSLEQGIQLFPGKAILGGLDDRSGVLVDGPDTAIEAEVHAILRRMQGTPFLLGADCTLPTEIPCSHIRAAVRATRTYAAALSQ